MRRFHKGFSLVEIMVGLAVGMIAMLVVMQVFQASEGQKRTTTSGADAQTNGATALYMIERDTKMVGWGMDPSMVSGCSQTFAYCDGNISCGGAAGAVGGVGYASVHITDGGNGPDAIAIQYYGNPNQDTYRYPGVSKLKQSMVDPSSELHVTSISGCSVGGMILLRNEDTGQCTVMQITDLNKDNLIISHAPSSNNKGVYNPPVAYMNDHGWPTYKAGPTLASCFTPAGGTPFYEKGYAVDTATRQLKHTDNSVVPAVIDEPVVPEIIDIQAQYGVAPVTPPPPLPPPAVNEWVDAAGPTWAAPTLDDLKRIKAIRVALVARSTQYERPPAGGACNTTTAAMVDKWSAWAKFDTTSYPADWQCYRYKVYETVVPFRNVMWGGL